MILAEYSKVLRRDPVAIAYYLLRKRSGVIDRAYANVVGSNAANLRYEFRESKLLRECFDRLAEMPYSGWVTNGEVLYVIVRYLKPETVVETGVAAGLSSACILAALEKNGKGELYSIDLPGNDVRYCPAIGQRPLTVLPKDKATGFLVPRELRSRWHLLFGHTKQILPALVSRLDSLDLFLHDSEHTEEMMLFEYRTAWRILRTGGLLVSHDVGWNNAFPKFCKEECLTPSYFWGTGFGIAGKPSVSRDSI